MSELENKIYDALGRVSMCWSETPKGVFDDTGARNIGDKLTAWINANYVKRDGLRDQFAGQVLNKLIQWDSDIEVVCGLSYTVADTAIAAREKAGAK
jgi:hypothetical protein